MLPAWISQHLAAALTAKPTFIPSLQQNLDESKFGLHPIITLASEDIYTLGRMDQKWILLPFAIPRSKKVTFVELEKSP